MRAAGLRYAGIGVGALLALALVVTFGGRVVEMIAAHVGRAAPGVVSFELGDAPPGPTAGARVALWLRRYRPAFEDAERRFAIDRRAIGAAIAYEALADPRTGTYLYAARFSGPGKVHYREHRFSEGDPAAKQVEDLGLMPPLGMAERRAALARPAVAIRYIAPMRRHCAARTPISQRSIPRGNQAISRTVRSRRRGTTRRATGRIGISTISRMRSAHRLRICARNARVRVCTSRRHALRLRVRECCRVRSRGTSRRPMRCECR